jgi:hypothetical protein
MHRITNITITPEFLKLIAEIDEFKGRWKVIETLAPEKLTTLRRIATIESVGSSTRIEGSKLSDSEVEKLLSGLHTKSFASRDEEEVAGYAEPRPELSEVIDWTLHWHSNGTSEWTTPVRKTLWRASKVCAFMLRTGTPRR